MEAERIVAILEDTTEKMSFLDRFVVTIVLLLMMKFTHPFII